MVQGFFLDGVDAHEKEHSLEVHLPRQGRILGFSRMTAESSMTAITRLLLESFGDVGGGRPYESNISPLHFYSLSSGRKPLIGMPVTFNGFATIPPTRGLDLPVKKGPTSAE